MSTGKNAWTYSAHHALEKLMDVHQTCIKNKHTAYRAYAVWDFLKKKKRLWSSVRGTYQYFSSKKIIKIEYLQSGLHSLNQWYFFKGKTQGLKKQPTCV